MDAKTTVDIWTALFEEKRREYAAEGMSAEEADLQASVDVANLIRNGPPIQIARD